MTSTPLLRRRSVKIALDVALFAGFITEFATREKSFDPDYVVHSVTGLALVLVISTHLLGNQAWIRSVLSKGRAHREAKLALLNLVLGVLALVCIVTGIPLWLSWTDSDIVGVVHAATGFFAVVTMFVHLGMNRRRIRSLIRPRRTSSADGLVDA